MSRMNDYKIWKDVKSQQLNIHFQIHSLLNVESPEILAHVPSMSIYSKIIDFNIWNSEE